MKIPRHVKHFDYHIIFYKLASKNNKLFSRNFLELYFSRSIGDAPVDNKRL